MGKKSAIARKRIIKKSAADYFRGLKSSSR